MRGTAQGYDDLDDDSAKNEEIEMKKNTGWRFEFDAQSDERRITSDKSGIVKSVEWNVQSREDPQVGSRGPVDDNAVGRTATSPAHIV
jgi:hypothetical protein